MVQLNWIIIGPDGLRRCLVPARRSDVSLGLGRTDHHDAVPAGDVRRDPGTHEIGDRRFYIGARCAAVALASCSAVSTSISAASTVKAGPSVASTRPTSAFCEFQAVVCSSDAMTARRFSSPCSAFERTDAELQRVDDVVDRPYGGDRARYPPSGEGSVLKCRLRPSRLRTGSSPKARPCNVYGNRLK